MKNKTITRIKFYFQALICISTLIGLGNFYNPTNSAVTREYFDIFVNSLSNSNIESSAMLCLISTDGLDYYASVGNRLIYGGPSDIGAVDGANAAAVINAAIIAGKEGRIQILKGNYTITSKINLLSNIELVCAKGATFALGYNGTMFEFSGVSFASLIGAEIDGNNCTGTPIVLKDFKGMAGAAFNTIMNNSVSCSGAKGISVKNSLSRNNNIFGNVVRNAREEGIMISRANNNNVIGNIVENTGQHGIISTGGSYNNISYNIVENAGGGYVSGFAHGVAVDGNGGLNPCYGNIVLGNIVKNAYMAGIEVADSAHFTRVTNNCVEKTCDYGIYFGGAFAVSNGGFISNNSVYYCGGYGILISGVTPFNRTLNVVVAGNMVERAGTDGIHLKWVNGSTIEGNTCVNCGNYGLAFADINSDYNVLINNDLRSNGAGGLNLNDANKLGTTKNNSVDK